MRWSFTLAIIAVGVLAFLLSCGGFLVPLEFAFHLAFGWVLFLMRVVPQVRVGWAGVATGITLLVLLAGGTHLFLGWLYGQVRGATGPRTRSSGDGDLDGPPRWSGGRPHVRRRSRNGGDRASGGLAADLRGAPDGVQHASHRLANAVLQ